jgi:hypothetical protein
MAKLVPRVIALLLCLSASAAIAQIAIPTLGSRGELPPGQSDEFAWLIDTFTEELRSAVSATGLQVSRADLITPGIAGSLDPEYARLIAELDGVRYAVSGEIAVVTDARAQGPFVVNMIVVDAEQDRATDLISRPLNEDDVRLTAVNLAAVIRRFTEQALSLPTGDAGLFVSSQPVDAEVYLDGVRIGETPVLDVVMLAPGRYQLELRKEGFLPEVRTVELRSQTTTLENVHLAPINGGSILVESTPSAEVFLGGLSQGNTPLFIPAPPGVPTVRLERQGFRSAIVSVPVRNYRTSRVDLELEPTQDPLLFWDVDRQHAVIIDGILQPAAYSTTARPGLIEVEIRRGRESRSYRLVLPAHGAFELQLETGELIPLK